MATAIDKSTASVQTYDSDKLWHKIGVRVAELLKYLILVPLAITFLFPIYWMFVSALKDNPQVFTIPPVLVPNPAFFENCGNRRG